MNSDTDFHGISVREALTLDLLKGVKVIAGSSGLDRIIKSVNVMEVPDILEWVKDGQLLLTTAFSIKDDKTAQEQLIPKLSAKGLAGLMIKPRRYINEIPASMIEAANENSFPLLEMPDYLSHPVILETIYEALVSRQSIILKGAVDAHKRLMDVTLKGGNLSEVCDTLHKICSNPVVILGVEENVMEWSPRESMSAALDDLINNTTLIRNTFLLKRIVKKNIEINGKEYPVISMPILISSQYYGSILIVELDHKMSEMDYVTLEEAAAVTALLIINNKAIQEVGRTYQNEFLFQWMNGSIKTEEVLIPRANVIGWDLRYNFVLILLRIDSYSELLNKDSRGTYEARRIRELLRNTVERTLNGKKEYFIIGEQGSNLLVLLKVPRNLNGDEAKTKALEVSDLIGKEFRIQSGTTCTIGIGRYRPNVIEMPACYEEARKAINVAKSFHVAGRIVHFDDLGIYRILYSTKHDEMTKFAADYYTPLASYDAENNTQLLDTIEKYFECNGNISKVAKALYTHYNTIVYRIERISKITGMDLDDPEHRLNLQMALKVGKILEKNSF